MEQNDILVVPVLERLRDLLALLCYRPAASKTNTLCSLSATFATLLRRDYNGKAMSTSIRGVAAIAICFLAFMASAVSMAAPDPAPGKAAFDEGRRLFQAGDYREALAQFKKGYVATEDPAFLLNIAQCHRFLGENNEAVMMYRLYLKSAPAGVDPEAHAVATQAIRELEIAPAAPATTSGAGAAPYAGTPAAAPPSPATPPTAAPPVAAPAASTTPRLSRTFTVSGRYGDQGEAAFPVLDAVPESDMKRLPPPQVSSSNPSSTMRHLRVAGVICASAGLASLGVGLYYWTRATSLSDSANKATVYNQADYDHGKRAETMQWIFYSAGAAAVVTGATLYVYGTWSPSAKKASVSLVPAVGLGATGLLAQGAF